MSSRSVASTSASCRAVRSSISDALARGRRETRGMTVDQRAELVDLLHAVRGHLGNEHAAVRKMHDQSFPRETLKRLAQRGAADVEPFHECLVGQHLSRSEFQPSDLAHEQLVRTLREGARGTLPLRYENWRQSSRSCRARREHHALDRRAIEVLPDHHEVGGVSRAGNTANLELPHRELEETRLSVDVQESLRSPDVCGHRGECVGQTGA